MPGAGQRALNGGAFAARFADFRAPARDGSASPPITVVAFCYALCMAQLVTRVSDELAAAVDGLIEAGEVASRSDAVRVALQHLIHERRRAAIARQILAGYQRIPETDEELTWAETATRGLVDDEPW